METSTVDNYGEKFPFKFPTNLRKNNWSLKLNSLDWTFIYTQRSNSWNNLFYQRETGPIKKRLIYYMQSVANDFFWAFKSVFRVSGVFVGDVFFWRSSSTTRNARNKPNSDQKSSHLIIDRPYPFTTWKIILQWLQIPERLLKKLWRWRVEWMKSSLPCHPLVTGHSVIDHSHKIRHCAVRHSTIGKLNWKAARVCHEGEEG